MKKVYLDNAATTALRPEVIQVITRILEETYGNPSSTHSLGRNSKVVVETVRKTIGRLLHAEAREIIFTSGGTEANNWIITNAVKHLKVQRIITSKIEHHSVLHVVEALQQEHDIIVDYINLQQDGSINTDHLKELLSENIPTLVSLIHVNNETGSILDLQQAGTICREHHALFHSDTVQSIGKTEFDLKNLPVDFLTASAHKFHGPKGIGFAYIRKNTGMKALLHGGEQEKGLRAGTEPIHQIAGMEKALELSYANLEKERSYITDLRNYLLNGLAENFPGFKINGGSENNLFYNIVNVMLPFTEDKTSMILFNLDMKGIAVSRGSACQSGSIKPSHVLKEILTETDIKKPSLRISLSHYNTKDDIDDLILALKNI